MTGPLFLNYLIKKLRISYRMIMVANFKMTELLFFISLSLNKIYCISKYLSDHSFHL